MRLLRSRPRSFLTWACALMGSLLALGAAAQSLSQPTDNQPCNRSVRHARCSYQSAALGGLTRHGLVCVPEQGAATPAPLLLVFHGHGGCAYEMAARTQLHESWPQAWVIYPDGLTGTATPNDPSGSQRGWQLYPNQQGDRDVALVRELVAGLTNGAAVDPARVYATGHSNGSRFVGVLWAALPSLFKALVFNAAQPGDLLSRYGTQMTPRSVALVMGQTDCVVPYNAALGCSTPVLLADNYQEASIHAVRAQLGLTAQPTPAPGAYSETSASGHEFGLYLHSGGHEWPVDLGPAAVAFFKRH